MNHHPQLQRLMKKKQIDFAGLNESIQWTFTQVNNIFDSFDQEKKLLNHVYEQSEKEFQKINAALASEIDTKESSIKKLKSTVRNLYNNSNFELNTGTSDLNDLVGALEKLLAERKQVELELEEKREAAMMAAKVKADFLAVMSHEIRTPLNAILGVSHLLASGEQLEHQKENIECLDVATNHLMLLINDIMDFTKLDQGAVTANNAIFNLRQLVSDAVKTFDYLIKSKNNIVTVNYTNFSETQFLGDATRLKQVLKNLISNANKFTTKGTIGIDLSLNLGQAEKNILSIKIKDTGIGIALEKQPRIFEEFFQSHSGLDSVYGGTGLGLAICKKTIELLGGTIRLESELGVGTCFTIELPMAVATANEELIVPKVDVLQSIKTAVNKKLLLVEDNKMNILVAKQFLKNWGYDCDVAINGAEALEKLKNMRYDIVLMDIHMPVLDGISCSKLIRAQNINVPIIALSASVTSEIRKQAADAGMNDFISKPFTPNSMKQKLAEYLN